MKKLRVTVDGKVYEVLVEMLDAGPPAAPSVATSAPLAAAPTIVAPAPVAAAPIAAAPAAGRGEGDIPSPLAGKVVSIDVTVGQAVLEGAQVATVEAMKMNTYVFAPKSGRVTAILANPGDGVEEGSVLLRLG